MKAISTALAVLLTAIPAGCLTAQEWRVGVWGSYEGVSSAADWSSYGGRITLGTRRGDALWASAELVNRFGVQDGIEKVGGTLHPNPRLWLTLEAGTAAGPEVVPKNSWELDASALAGRGVATGLGYRRLNYVAGPVDILMPHATLDLGALSWDARLFLSRNPSRRTDAAFLLRVSRVLPPRALVWAGVGAGRESYLTGAPPAQVVQSLKTVTGTAGVRVAVGRDLLVRLDVTVVSSEPVLSRRGLVLTAERRF